MTLVRVRFAPSPTGPLHIGGLRTALYNYLHAKNSGGTFILRIEDTDQNRFVEGADAYIRECLDWVGLHFDEGPGKGGDFGPYRQSERKEIYLEYIQHLLKSGAAYYAFDTHEELDALRSSGEGKGTLKYDHSTRVNMRNSLSLTAEETNIMLESEIPKVVRLKVDSGKTVTFSDIVRGDVSFQSDELDDKVLLKADGMPTYHFANVVDDYLMKISHVIRGEEWLSSTAHHVLLYQAFGWDENIPQFAHLPLILKPSGKGKLSKRDGQKFGFPVFPLSWKDGEDSFEGFREYGFEPEALINFLALLGWNPGTEQEIFSISELEKSFDLSKVVKSGARFDWQKALWFNEQYLRNTSSEELLPRVTELFKEKGSDYKPGIPLIELLKPRVTTLNDFYTQTIAIFDDIKEYDQKMIRKKWKEPASLVYPELIQDLAKAEVWTAAHIKEIVVSFMEKNGLGFGQVLPLMRLGIAGTTQGPDLFELSEIMGKDKVISRLQDSLEVFPRYK